MLSFKIGRPIAIIRGGKHSGKIINLFDPNKKCCEKCSFGKDGGKGSKHKKCCDYCDPNTCSSYTDDVDSVRIRGDVYEVLDEDFIRSHKKKLSMAEMNDLRRALESGKKPTDKNLIDIYNKLKEEYDKRSMKELIITDDGIISALPNYQDPERAFIGGPSGSGKSFFVSRYLENLRRVFNDRDIFLFSDVGDDECLDKFKPIRIKLDEKFLEDKYVPESFEDSIVVFDDIDSIENKKIKEKVGLLRDALLKRGRHKNTSVIVTNHLLNDYKNTRGTLNEVGSITFFPKCGSSHSIQYMLKMYVGLSAKQIQKIFSLPSRAVTVYKHYPMYVISDRNIHLL
jgi:hypothetical protein